MAVALGQERLGYTQEQIDSLHEQVQKGDLTSVLRVYEDDIKSPIRSAVSGTLVRSLLIQIQKMKVSHPYRLSLQVVTQFQVDVDFALSGIDKLLRSQELTFGFVGVAPALAIVYLATDWMWGIWRGGRGRGRYGGKKQRRKVWSTMRRIEKLLILQPKVRDDEQLGKLMGAYQAVRISPLATEGRLRNREAYSEEREEILNGGALSPLTNGLLFLATTQLRTFAETCLRHSRSATVREEFLDDVRALEDGLLSCDQKLAVVARMWRCWARELGWEKRGDL